MLRFSLEWLRNLFPHHARLELGKDETDRLDRIHVTRDEIGTGIDISGRPEKGERRNLQGGGFRKGKTFVVSVNHENGIRDLLQLFDSFVGFSELIKLFHHHRFLFFCYEIHRSGLEILLKLIIGSDPSFQGREIRQ